MNFKCLFGHQWNGNVCKRCGKMRNVKADTSLEKLTDKEKTKLEDFLKKTADWEQVAELYVNTNNKESKKIYLDWLMTHACLAYKQSGLIKLLNRDTELIKNQQYIKRTIENARNQYECINVIEKITDQTMLSIISQNTCRKNVYEKDAAIGEAAAKKITDPITLQKFIAATKHACEKGKHFWELVSSENSDNYGTTDNYVTHSYDNLYKCKFCAKKESIHGSY